jgi:hypothetical protein
LEESITTLLLNPQYDQLVENSKFDDSIRPVGRRD